jgi:hypothetical protein
MFDLQNCKFVNVTPPAAIIDNAAAVTATLDTLGWRKVCFLVALGALDIAVSAMKLQQSDASNMSGAADISGADFSVSPLTLPSATDDNKLYAIFVDMRGKKRYLDLSLTLGDGAAGSFVAVLAILNDGEIYPSTATLRGLGQQAIV